ncbi:hypothetical protein QTJ16_001759 [Diplocarpon rosae]|uniref:Fork-head domain-containing protein n=1 Tax=Diplocarpon rosae TaxID=946125 RepID=A0AAD9T377_9HELO|nr:hypothetical protein QTJ16_001759 [Diplocarpon rosae]
MSSTRYSQPPLQIYHDPAASFDRAPMPSEQSANNPQEPTPLRPIKNAASRRRIVFNPPHTGPSKHSPLKSAPQTSSSPSRASFASKLNSISMPPPGGASYHTDSMEKKQPAMASTQQKNLLSNFTTALMEQENYSPSYQSTAASADGGMAGTSFSREGLHDPKPPRKRLLEAAPIHESRACKQVKTEPSQEAEEPLRFEELPAPDSFPPLHDDGTKPPHSYAQLIGMSILRAPNRRLTLAQIYKWISDTYSFYNAQDAGWQNSIRHNLSLNKAFIKQERPKDDPGKGNYWAIQSGMEHVFIREKVTKKPAGPNENIPVLSTNLSPVHLPETAQFKPPPPPAHTPELPPPPTYALPDPMPTTRELSSDATIPGSDACNTDPEHDGIEAPSSPLIHSSPPPMAAMQSSPPVARHVPKRPDTSPAAPRFHAASTTRGHTRKEASADDSGYFSSLDSSAVRPNRLLTSEAERPRMKRGRAEEEIARLRGSSYDSPTKGRALFVVPSSSPLRPGAARHERSMLPPLTPAVKLKAPVRQSPSISPNTNLRMHRDRVREMVGSPLRGMTTLEDTNAPWSPAFHLDDASSYVFQDFGADFDIFDDNSSSLAAVSNGSPEKRSAKRPRVDRARSANILADISNASLNKSLTSTPLLKFTANTNICGSPTKTLGRAESPSKLLGLDSPAKMASPKFNLAAFDLPQEDFFGAEFLAEEINEGWDIMQGFQKIGSGAGNPSHPVTTRSPKACSARPPLGRSFTSRF